MHHSNDVGVLLIQSGDDINAINNQNLTPLHCAAWGNAQDVTKYLIEVNVDINAQDEHSKYIYNIIKD